VQVDDWRWRTQCREYNSCIKTIQHFILLFQQPLSVNLA
jgi:hypothetical protein